MSNSQNLKTLFKAIAVTGTGVYYSDWVETNDLDARTAQVSWTGNMTGATEVQFSNDAVISTEKDRIVGAASDGTQGKTVARGSASTARFVVANSDNFLTAMAGADPAGSASSAFYTFYVRPKWYRIKYTNATGSGVMDGWGMA